MQSDWSKEHHQEMKVAYSGLMTVIISTEAPCRAAILASGAIKNSAVPTLENNYRHGLPANLLLPQNLEVQ